MVAQRVVVVGDAVATTPCTRATAPTIVNSPLERLLSTADASR